MTARRRASAATLLAAAALLFPAPMAPAAADPTLPELRGQAVELRHQLEQLAVQQGLAVEAFDTAVDAVQQATTAQVLAAAALSEARRSAATSTGREARRARALYMSGGAVGLSATVLDSTDLSDVLTRWQAVTAIVRADARSAARSTASGGEAVRSATRTSRDVEQARNLATARQQAADQAGTDVHELLEQQAALLSRTDARVVALAQEQQKAAEARAVARAAESARQAGIAVSPPVTSSPDRPPSVTAPARQRWAAPTSAAGRAIEAARTRIGLPYVWGATGPDSFDCSGLTGWAYRQAGVVLPRTSRQQYAALPKVPLEQLLPGDLVFYATDAADPATIHHVGIYIGGGLTLYAPQTGRTVTIGPIRYGRVLGAVRPTVG